MLTKEETAKLRSIWRAMISRCHPEKGLPRYGLRGIRVTDEWRGKDGFERFCAHMGARPSDEYSIDRIFNDGNYEPGNVRWATQRQQMQNYSKNYVTPHYEPNLDGSLALVETPPPKDRHPAYVYLARLSTGSSRHGAASALRRICGSIQRDSTIDSFPWHLLRYPHAVALRSFLIGETASPATINMTLSVLRGVTEECYRLGLMSSDDYTRIKLIKAVRGSREIAGRAISADEIGALFSACDPTNQGSRDAAILAVAYGCGLRRAELVGLDWGDYEPPSKRFRVIGKGNKERFVPLSLGVLPHLQRWVALRGDGDGPFFLSIDRFDRIKSGVRMRTAAVAQIVGRIAAKAGVAYFSPHDLRRTFVTDLLDAGGDLGAVQKAAGHASVSTTLRYDRRGDAAAAAVVEKLKIPT